MISNEKYKIIDGEDDETYELRICSYHDSDRLTWTEVAEIINNELGVSFSESKYRKEYSAYRKGVVDAEKGATKIDFEPTEIEFDDEEQKLREKYGDSGERIPYYRLLRQDGRFERFYQKFAERVETYPVPKYIGLEQAFEENQREFVLTIADIHAGAKFESVNNSYSIEEVTRRMNVLFNYTVKFIQEKKLTKLKVVSLGDAIQGMLRISDAKLNETSVVDAFVYVCRIIANFLNELSAYVEIDFHQVCFSNHEQTRPIGTKASELAGEDFGKIMLAYITDVLRYNNRISVHGDPKNDFVEFNIFNFNCIALHGHQTNKVNDLCASLSNRNRKFYDYVFVGHTHSAKEIITAEGKFHDIETLVSGSFIGSDPYADSLMLGSKASCKMYEFDEIQGHIASYKFILN